jgi:hypothetical protein
VCAVSVDLASGIAILVILLAGLATAFSVPDSYQESRASEGLARANGARVTGVAGLLAGVVMVVVAGGRVLRAHDSRAVHHRVPTHDWQALGFWALVVLMSIGVLAVVSKRRRAVKREENALRDKR